jgi:Glycoside hydrolase family 44
MRTIAPRPRLLQPFAKYRPLLRPLIILLVILLILAAVHLSSVLSAANDQLLVRLGNQSTIMVDLRQNFPISPYLFGANAFPEVNTSQDHNGLMNYGPPITNGLRNAHIKLLRFPGGVWNETHLLSYDQINAFNTLLSQVGAEGMIQARLSRPAGPDGSSESALQERATLAGNWVDYMNNQKSSLRTGKYIDAPFHPIKFWTVGNEPDQLLNPDTEKPFTVEEYTNHFILFSTTMHQKDPTIQVFGPEISQFYGVGIGPKDAHGQLWVETFLKGVHTYEKAHPELKFHLLDGVSFHFYPFADTNKSPAALLSSTNEWNYLLPPLRQLIRQELERDAPVAVTEINTSATKQVSSRGFSALWWADTLGTLMNQEVKYVAFFAAEGVDPPYPLFSSDGLHETPMFRVMQLFSHLQHNLIPIEVRGNSINMYATQDEMHETVSLLLVNNLATTQLAQVSAQNQFLGISGWHDQDISLYGYSITVITFHRGGGAEAYSYGMPPADDTNIAPLTYAVCGHQADMLANKTPC